MDDLWCDNCQKSHEGLCKNRGALHKVQDSVIPSRARLTLPPSLTLKTVKENGRNIVGVFAKKVVPVRSQFGPFDAPVIARTKIGKKDKQTTTVWKKKHAMQKAMETSAHSHFSESSDANTSASDVQTSPVLPTQPSSHHKGQQSVSVDTASLPVTDIASLQQQLLSMSSQSLSQATVSELQQSLGQLPLQSSPVHSNASLSQLQHSLQDFAPIGFPSPSGTMQLQVTPENIQQLHQHFMQYGQQTELAQLNHSLNINGYPPTTSLSNHSVGPDSSGSVMVNMAPPSELGSQTTEDSGVGDTSHVNMSDSLNADVTSDTDLDEGLEQDLTFELKIVTYDGYMETLDTHNEDYCNWMIFVRPAKFKSEQNLIAYQEDGNIFFVSLKPITANTELRVWYSTDYAKSINKAMLPEEEDYMLEEEDRLFCPTCYVTFSSKREMDNHPCFGKGKGRRKGRPRKYVKPTKTWRAKLERTRLKETQVTRTPDTSVNQIPPPAKRGRGRPRIRPLVVKPEQVEVKPVEEEKPEPSPQLLMDFEAENGDDYIPDPEPEPEDEDDDDDPLEEKKLVIKEKKKRGPKSTRAPMHCPHCSETFVAEAVYYVHVYTHTGIKPFICEVPDCERGFLSKFKLERHRLIHTCPRHHKCPYCDKSFNRKDHLKNHMITHDPNKKIWKCDICGKEYSYRFSYRTHIAFHAAENGETLACGICKKVFDTKEALLFHLKVHTGARAAKNTTEKTHPCFECGKKFFTRKDVKRHMITHTKRKDFLCQFCPQRFGRKDHLTRHLRTSHTGDNQTNGRVRRSTGDSSSPVKRRDRTLMFEKMEPTMVPLQMGVPVAIQDDIQDQLLAGVTGVSQSTNLAGSQATLLQNLQYAVSQIPGQHGTAREIQIPAALYEAAAAAAASAQQQQQEQQQQQQQQVQTQQQQTQQPLQVGQVAASASSLTSIPAPPGMPTVHTSVQPHYQINEKGYVMTSAQPEQTIVRQIQVAPNIDYRNLAQALPGNMYIATANPQALQPQQQIQQQPQQQQQQQQPQTQATQPQQAILAATKLDPQTLEISRNNGITTIQQPAEYQVAARQVVETVNSVGTATELANRPSVVMASAVDPRQASHPQAYSTTILGYMETLRFLENLPTNNATAIQLQQLQGLNVDISQAQTAQILPAAYNTSVAGNNILNINQADLAKGVVAISHPHAIQLDVKNMVSLAQTATPTLATHHVAYQQQQQSQHQT